MRRLSTSFLSLVLLSNLALTVQPSGVGRLRNLDQKTVGKYQSIKSNYLKTVDLYQKGRQDFLKAKENAARLGNAAAQKNLLTAAKKHLKNALNTIIRHLQVLKKRIENAPGIDDDTRAKLLTEIDADISFLQGKLETVDEISSIAEIRDLGKTLRDYWLKTRARSKAIVGHILAARFSHFMGRLENVSRRLRSEVENLQAKGVDTSKVEALLDNFDQNLALAEEKYTAAVDVFKSISNPSNANDLFVKGHNLLKEAQSYLRQAHRDLREAVAALKVLIASTKSKEATATGLPR